MIEYPAMIYKNNRSQTYVANCMAKNLIGFGQTEEDAIKNLEESLKSVTQCLDLSVMPIYRLSIAQ